MTLDRFYPIFDHPDWLARALPLGVRLAQLRLKNHDEISLRKLLVQGRDLCRQAQATLVVNDHWKLAIDLGCDWVHLGQEDLDSADVPAIRRAEIKLGISTHDEAELDRALSLAADYVALGPVWPTVLKKMKWRRQGLGRVREWKDRIGDTPLVAIGGLRVERASSAFAAGADTVAVVTDISFDQNPEARMSAWIGVTR